MGYTQYKSVADLANPEPFETAAMNAADRWTHLTSRRAAELTPIAKPPEGLSAQQFTGGRARVPGTAKESWEIDAPRRVGDRVSAGFFSRDPITIYLENGTRPHDIRPRMDRAAASVLATGKPRATGSRAALRFYVNGRPVYSRVVHHPGTRPILMAHRAVAESVLPLREILREELQKALDDSGQRGGGIRKAA